ncbi:MAG: DUF448 domain-containing protein [Campylobacterota bacterium]|nr:DUF448 domain-containing protein [Campylobacterota bacterium]
MARKFHKPQRMCVTCRGKFAQSELVRLQCQDRELIAYTSQGRSFYLCKTCIDEAKRCAKSLARQCKSGELEKLMNQLREIIIDVR